MFLFKKRVVDKGTVLFKPGDNVDMLRIVKDGVIDIFVNIIIVLLY
jgi:hypothetical protein